MKKTVTMLLVSCIVFCFSICMDITPFKQMRIQTVVYANEIRVNSEDPIIYTNARLLEVIHEKAESLTETYMLNISKDINVEEFINNASIGYIYSIEYNYYYMLDERGLVVPQEYTTYAFRIGYRDGYMALCAFRDKSLMDKLYSRERKVLEKAKQIIANEITSEMSDYQKEVAIHDYLIKNGKYDTRIYSGKLPDSSRNAEGILLNGVGVCSSYADSMCLLLGMVDVECIYVVGKCITNDGYVSDHAWNKVKIDGKWYNVDATWNDPVPDYPGDVSYTYFNITDEVLARDHSWDKKTYTQKADSTKYNYYEYNKLIASDYEQFKSIIKSCIQKQKQDQVMTIKLYVKNYKQKSYNMDFIQSIIAVENVTYTDIAESEGEMTIYLTLY